jgi:AcrR family transcriptional regulator
MAPRAYFSETRRQLQAELKARLAAAAAELHAEQGAIATSYADIARRAGVSLPTVYHHFPSQEELISACTGHAASLAPPLPAADILAAPDLPAAAEAIVDALDRIHAHFEPWQVWREHRLIPALGALADTRRRELTKLLEQVLARHGAGARAARIAAVWESLLHFELWHRLARAHQLPRAAVRRTLVQLLLAASGPQPAAPRPPSVPKEMK